MGASGVPGRIEAPPRKVSGAFALEAAVELIRPPKEAVRAYQQKRLRSSTPPPDPDQIRRELGWGLVQPKR
jgi:hypothetical protein